MPKASVKRIINCSKEDLINLVLNIEDYPKFIPYCLNAKIYEKKLDNDDQLIIADLTIGKGLFKDTYKSDVKTGRPNILDPLEPKKISIAVKKLNLRHVVITSVDRDDLDDGGSNHFYETIMETRKENPDTTIEVLTPDFLRKGEAYKKVLDAKPDVFNHNIETVPSLYLKVRPGSRYFASLELLKNTKIIDKNIFTKSGIMVGMGETKDEIIQVMDDLRSANVDFLTIGQYLQPSVKHFPLQRYYDPIEFKDLETIAKAKGFLLVSSSPLTRSSYHADEDFALLKKNRKLINAKSISKENY